MKTAAASSPAEKPSGEGDDPVAYGEEFERYDGLPDPALDEQEDRQQYGGDHETPS
jgi:hypothetical protein